MSYLARPIHVYVHCTYTFGEMLTWYRYCIDHRGYMTMTMPNSMDDETYLTMVKTFPLQRIRDDAELDASIAVIDSLLDMLPNLTMGEQEYLDALGQLVEAYENEHVQLPEARGVDVLLHLMEENDLKQVDLVPIFGTKSIVSEVLNGKRRLTVGHVRELSSRFGLPADVFID